MISIGRFLGSPGTYKALLGLNLAVTCLVFLIFLEPHGGDVVSYLALRDGILNGSYSMWWDLPVEVPDTFRNPGYPLFLAFSGLFTDSLLPVQIAQLLLYLGSVAMSLGTITRLGGGIMARNAFLLILLPSINIAFYNTGLYAEIPTLFLIGLFVWLNVKRTFDIPAAIAMALVCGLAFQMRSALLLFPMIWVIGHLLLERSPARWRNSMLFLVIFGLTTVPYSLWNQRHHGIYKPTPLESGGGAMHIGWWSGKIPGHQETWYWHNFSPREIFNFTPPDSVEANVERFNAEWQLVDSLLRPYLTATDTVMLAAHAAKPSLFRTYSTGYTLAREQLLKELTWRNIQNEPGYTLIYKGYSAIRLWITGIPVERLRETGPAGVAGALYPFLLTMTIFLLALLLIPGMHLRWKGAITVTYPLLVWLVYFAVIHIPFSIQARYTIPVRLLLFILIALSLEFLIRGRLGPGNSSTRTEGAP